MRILVALLIGSLIATGSVVVIVHDANAVRPAPTRALFNYGSG